MLMEFEKHRADRKALSVAFKPEPMRHYAAALNDGIRARVAQWSGTTFPFYPAIKQLTLDLAATSFLGIPWGPEAERINKARSEEHTSELQSLMRISYAVFCLKKKITYTTTQKDKHL